MQVKGHGTGVAIALAALAVVLAGTGTAVAVSSQVTIVDPMAPSRAAKVDADGRLATSGVTSSIVVTRNVSTPGAGASTDLTAPTTATLAISRVNLGNPTTNAGTNAAYTIYLEKHPVVDGACSRLGAVQLAHYEIAPGDHVTDVLPQPIVVKPTGGVPYCVSALGFTTNGGADGGGYYAWIDLAASVVSGRYTGNGIGAAEAPVDPRQAKTER